MTRRELTFLNDFNIILLSCMLVTVFTEKENLHSILIQNAVSCEADDVPGYCVESHHCYSTNPYIEGLVYPPNCTLSDGEQGVCCTDCKLVGNASDAMLDGRGNLHWKTGQKSFDKCIEWIQQLSYSCHHRSWSRPQLITPPSVMIGANDTRPKCYVYGVVAVAPVGGVDVHRGEFPHMVLVGYRDTKQSSDWLCSGSLISDRYVLTAAHCLNSKLGPVTEIAAGMLRRSDLEEYWHRYKISEAIPHPDYHSPSVYNDIALLQTEKAVEFVKDVRPACLPAMISDEDYRQTYLQHITAAGWGALGHRRELADTLQKVSLVDLSVAECSATYTPHRHLSRGIDKDTQICYGDRAGVKDTCGGDSGGPLQRDTARPACITTILGVTSVGHACGHTPAAGVYTRVAPYLPWIESIVWK